MMTFGLLSAILEEWDYKEMIDTVSGIGYKCVEVACWPKGKGERRYAGTSHIDTENLGKAEAEDILQYAAAHDVRISSLAYYPNTLDPDLEKRAAAIKHIHSLIDASSLLGVNMVTTFIGRDFADSCKTVDMMCGLLLYGVFGLHIQLFSHLVAIVSEQIIIQRFVIAGNGTAD